jgi:putative membrane protein
MLSEVAFGAGIAVTLWLIAHFGLQAVGQAFSRIGLRGIILLTLARAPALACLGLCWWLLAGATGGKHPIKFVWGRLMRDASGDLLPFSPVGGYILGVRAVILTGVPAVTAAVSGILDIIVEQFAKAPYMAASVACLLWLAPGRADLGTAFLGVLVVTIGLTVAIGLRWNAVRARLIKAAGQVSRYWPIETAAAQPSAEGALSAILADRRRTGIGFCLQFAGWCFGAAEAWLALRLLGVPVGYGEAVAIDGAYAAIRVFAFAVPAAIGVQEGGYVAICSLFGIDPVTALAFSLLRRTRDVMLGAPTVLAWQFMERERRTSRARQGT